MKTIKMISLFVLIALLASGCAGNLLHDETEDACKTTTLSAAAPAAVPSFADTAVVEAPAVAVPVAQAPVVAAPVLQNIYFDFDQHTLTDQARYLLDENSRYFQVNASANVVITGHCDERGSDEYNLALGERRAIAAQNYLVSMGLAPQRVSTISYGEEKPVNSANTEEAWAQNRRDEFIPQF